MKIWKKDLECIMNCLSEALAINSWSEIINIPGSYTMLCKQGLNMIITYFWSIEVAYKGEFIRKSFFPKLAIQKLLIGTKKSNIRLPILKEALIESGNSITDFNEKCKKELQKELSPEFYEFIFSDLGEKSLEFDIFNASSKLASLVEILEISEVSSYKKCSILKNILKEFWKYHHVPGFWNMIKLIPIFVNISRVRHRIRYTNIQMSTKFSDLGHMFETGIFEYLISVSINEPKAISETHFFNGMFHDIAENYTGDFPSPFKNYFNNFSKGIERIESRMIKNNILKHLQKYQKDALIPILDEFTRQYDLKPIRKLADEFDSAFECYRAILAGDRTPELPNIFLDKFKDLFSQENGMVLRYPECFQEEYISMYFKIGAPDFSKWAMKINEIEGVYP